MRLEYNLLAFGFENKHGKKMTDKLGKEDLVHARICIGIIRQRDQTNLGMVDLAHA